jgi:hypothetical protein
VNKKNIKTSEKDQKFSINANKWTKKSQKESKRVKKSQKVIIVE